jgi:DNA-binding winged helix-turn-helix (wHTH) protein
VREIAGLRLDPFRREVYRDGRYVPLTRKQFAVLEVLVAAEGGVVSAEKLLRRAWEQNADPFTNAVRITVSALRKRLDEPWIIATVPGAGYRIDTQQHTEGSASRCNSPPRHRTPADDHQGKCRTHRYRFRVISALCAARPTGERVTRLRLSSGVEATASRPTQSATPGAPRTPRRISSARRYRGA